MVIDTLLSLILLYLFLGLFFSIPFVIKGASAIDEGARGSSWGFKIIIIPGSIVFWPLLLNKWMQSKKEDGKSSQENV